jgi:hypothetical protein
MILYLESGQSKLVHVVLGKGITVPSILVCDERRQFQKFLYCFFGNIFLDLSNYNIVLKCDKKVSNEIESPWYYMFRSLIRKEYNCFLDIEFIQKYVSLYGSILSRLNDSVLEVTGKEFTSGYARLLLNYDKYNLDMQQLMDISMLNDLIDVISGLKIESNLIHTPLGPM